MFRDRTDAGKQLAHVLLPYRGQSVIFALPRGGVVPGVEVARALDAPMDLIVVRKIGHPFNQEYAIAAVAEDGYVIASGHEIDSIDKFWFDRAVAGALKEAQRRRRLFLEGRPPVSVKGRIAIIVDDGLATGLTMLAAIHEIRKRGPRKLVVAVPVAPSETVNKLRAEVDDLVVLYIPKRAFGAIGRFYQCFDQVSDHEVVALLRSASLVETVNRVNGTGQVTGASS